MRVEQKRICSLNSHLLGVSRRALVTPALLDVRAHGARLRQIGFPQRLEVGQVLLPAVVGPRSRFNADGQERVHRDRPKEFVTRLAWARWLERHGDDQREIRGVRPWKYERFPRTLIPAPNIELRVVGLGGGRLAVVAETLRRGADDQRLLHSVNLMLELFGECHLLEGPVTPIAPSRPTRLNWELLADPGLPEVPSRLEAVVEHLPRKDRQVVDYRIARVGELEPDFIALGRAGFRGYAMFGFGDRGRFVLESLYYGNETVVSDRRWQELESLGKGELLRECSDTQRIEHSRGWESRLREAVSHQAGPGTT